MSLRAWTPPEPYFRAPEYLEVHMEKVAETYPGDSLYARRDKCYEEYVNQVRKLQEIVNNERASKEERTRAYRILMDDMPNGLLRDGARVLGPRSVVGPVPLIEFPLVMTSVDGAPMVVGLYLATIDGKNRLYHIGFTSFLGNPVLLGTDEEYPERDGVAVMMDTLAPAVHGMRKVSDALLAIGSEALGSVASESANLIDPNMPAPSGITVTRGTTTSSGVSGTTSRPSLGTKAAAQASGGGKIQSILSQTQGGSTPSNPDIELRSAIDAISPRPTWYTSTRVMPQFKETLNVLNSQVLRPTYDKHRATGNINAEAFWAEAERDALAIGAIERACAAKNHIPIDLNSEGACVHFGKGCTKETPRTDGGPGCRYQTIHPKKS